LTGHLDLAGLSRRAVVFAAVFTVAASDAEKARGERAKAHQQNVMTLIHADSITGSSPVPRWHGEPREGGRISDHAPNPSTVGAGCISFGGVSWLSACDVCSAFPGFPEWLGLAPLGRVCPITVAGPRRIHTGFPPPKLLSGTPAQ
jgi:hypothetical protein